MVGVTHVNGVARAHRYSDLPVGGLAGQGSDRMEDMDCMDGIDEEGEPHPCPQRESEQGAGGRGGSLYA